MRFSKSFKDKTTIEGKYIVYDVKASDLKGLGVPYTLYRDGYNCRFCIDKEHLPKLIILVEDRHKPYWQEQINNEVKR